MKNKEATISYSQCWEDPRLLEEALAVNHDDVVLSIMSGGDNSLALLAKSPKELVSIDINETQKYVLEAKIAAIKALDYDSVLGFVGARKSNQRKELFEKINPDLSEEAKDWWDKNPDLIENGVINVGKFETFLNIFRTYVLPLIHSRKIVQDFLQTKTIEDQRKFYRTVWDSKRWRLLFKILTSRFVLKNFARQKGMFSHTRTRGVGSEYLERLDRNFMSIPLQKNYFMHYCLTGNYGPSLPSYLERDNIGLTQANLPHLKMIVNSLKNYLESMPDSYFSKFNLSDVFEPLSIEQNDALWQQIVRTAKPGARIVYWNNLVLRTFPKQLSASIKDEIDLAHRLHSLDRVYFYGSFHVNTIIK